MDTKPRYFQFENGLVLLFEEIPWSESFAVGINVPAGSSNDPDECPGLASITCEMTNRGAGQYDNRSLLEAMESIGIRSSERAAKLYANFNATGLCENWERTLELLALQIREPRFPKDEFSSCQQILLQEITADEDDPFRKTYQAFNSIFLPGKLGLPTLGTKESVCNLTIGDVEKFHHDIYRPNGTIIAITGRLDWNEVRDKVESLFGDWEAIELTTTTQTLSSNSTIHILSNTTQITFVLGYQDVPNTSPEYWYSLGGVRVLSGGMSSRLFTEVREKRGLCYSVSASHCTLDSMGYVVCSCGTNVDSAQQSLDVIINEVDRLSVEPITKSELDRVKIRIKSSMVMQRESTARRVGALLSDWHSFKRIIPLEEDLHNLESLNCELIEAFYAKRPKKTFRIATSGPRSLDIPIDRVF